jgi:hypothetical protein
MFDEDGKSVWPGQRYRMDGETLKVSAIFSDAYERTALCIFEDGGVLHIPAGTLVRTAECLP